MFLVMTLFDGDNRENGVEIIWSRENLDDKDIWIGGVTVDAWWDKTLAGCCWEQFLQFPSTFPKGEPLSILGH